MCQTKHLLVIKDSKHLKFLRKPGLTVDLVVRAENNVVMALSSASVGFTLILYFT